MQYLNQTIIFMSQQNKELKEKVRRLEQICKNITETNRLASGNGDKNDKSLVNIQQSEFEKWQLSNPTSTKNEYSSINHINHQQINLIKSQSTVQQFFSSSTGATSTTQYNLLAIQNLQKQLQQLKQQLSSTTHQFHQTQIESLNRANKTKQLNAQLNRAKDEVGYLKKEVVREKEMMKGFYETTVVEEMRERFEEKRSEQERKYMREKELLEGQLRDLRQKVQSQHKIIVENEKQLNMKNAKQQRLLAIISQLKLLLQSSSQQHQQQTTHLTNLLSSTTHQLTQLKLSKNTITEQFQQKQHQNDLLQFQLKKIKQQIGIIKRQHERSISRTERELQRERSMSKNIEKQYSMERKILQTELKKKQSNEKYHLKKERELISKIKTIDSGGQSVLLTQNSKTNLSNLNLSSLSSIDMSKIDVDTRKSKYQAKSPISKLNISNRMSQQSKSPSPINHNKKELLTLTQDQSSKPSFTKYLENTPQNGNNSKNQNQQAHQKKVKQRFISTNSNDITTKTPKSVVKLKANTIGVINNNNNKDKHQSLTVTARTKKQSTPSTSRCHQQSQNKSTGNSISLKDTKYHNQTVTEFLINPHGDGATNPNNNSPTFHSQQSSIQQINNYSSIDILKDNLNYFPSNKTSKNNSPQKISPFRVEINLQIDEMAEKEKEDKFSFNGQIQELRKLEHYMRTSFNPNHNNHQRFFESEIGRKELDINSQKKQVGISQLNLVSENNEPDHTPYSKNILTTKRKQLISEQLINKLLENQSSNHKQHTKDLIIPQNIIRNRPQQIEELLTSTQRHFRINNGQKSQKTTKQPFSFVSLVSSNQKSPQTILGEKSLKNLRLDDKSNEQLYKPNKALMKLTDLDTPCFESALINKPKTNRDHAMKQSQQSYLIAPNSTRENLQKRKRISISIANLSQTQTTNLSK